MKFYFAPLEGITGHLFRQAHRHHFAGIDKYFAPFIVANQSRGIRPRDRKDILPENNPGIKLVPQILSNKAGDFLAVAEEMRLLGYEEINFNLGCPSGTVVSKGRGAGFLASPRELDAFLDQVFSQWQNKLSIKTRLGVVEPEEFYQLMEIYNKYPLAELIIHPRVQKDVYKNTPNLEVFCRALKLSKCPVCYNGDLFTKEDYLRFQQGFPAVSMVMLGRGLLANPGLIGQLSGDYVMHKAQLRSFHDELYLSYRQHLHGDRPVLFKMKELWWHLAGLFPDSKKYSKRIKKAESIEDYDAAVSALFAQRDLWVT